MQGFEFVSSSVALFANVEMSVVCFKGCFKRIKTYLRARKAVELELGTVVERMLG